MVTRYLNTLRRGCDDMNKITNRDLTLMRLRKKDISLLKLTHRGFA
jgi:hypothetical protein